MEVTFKNHLAQKSDAFSDISTNNCSKNKHTLFGNVRWATQIIFRFCISDITLHSAQQCSATDRLTNYVRPAVWLSEGLWRALF